MSIQLRTYKLGEFLKRVKNGINLEDSKHYKRATIRIKNKGVSVRDELLGKNIKTKKQFLISRGQFLMSKIDARNGAFGIVPDELDNGIITGNFWTFNVDKNIVLAEFFRNFTLAPDFIEICKNASTGSTNRKYLNETKFLDIEIHLPAITEQKIILKKLNAIKIKHLALTEEIEKQQSYLAKLRQTILQDAVEGKLTKDWRIQNPTIETVEDLLIKIKSEKKQLIKEKKIKKEKSLPKINEENAPFEIPSTWKWSRFQDLYNSIEAGKSPKCLPYPANDDQWGVIKMSAISWGKFQENENKMLPLNLIPFVDKEIKAGDFILTRANTRELIARSVIVGENVRNKLLLNDKTLRINVSKFVNKEFLNISNTSPYARNYYWNAASGTSDSMKNISRLKISFLVVPLPPISEQIEIVKKVNQLLSNCDSLEHEIKSNKENSEILMQSVLSESLGKENNVFDNKKSVVEIQETLKRESKYNSKTSFMDLVKLLTENGKLHAEDLWKMSKFPEDIDAFYAELKNQIELEKTIKESNEKGYLELV